MSNTKIKCHLLSDLHLEFFNNYQETSFFNLLKSQVEKDEPEFAILAGDITNFSDPKEAQRDMQSLISLYGKVVYVPGNHEFYGNKIETGAKVLRELKDLHKDKLILLDNDSVSFVGHNWVGGTMWFPKGASYVQKGYLNDFRRIADAEPDIYERHDDFVFNTIPMFTKDCIVVTHHLPFPESIDERYKKDWLNIFFMYDCTKHLKKTEIPKMWFHGHTHHPCSYTTTDGIVVKCNPKGYLNENSNNDFFQNLLVTI